MVVAYLLILTAVTGYACWRGYQLEVWVGELSKTVGQLANSVTKMDLRQERFGAMELPDRLTRLEQAHNMVVNRLGRDMDYNAVTYGPLLSLLDKPKKAAKKPRGKK